jgi:ribosomal protein L11 methyltransferase
MRNPDTWKVTVDVDGANAETAEFVLGELGSMGSIEESAARENIIRISAFFDKEFHERDMLRDRIVDAFAAFPELRSAWIEIDLEPACDWNERWKELFKPFEIAKGFVIVPSWEEYKARPGDRIVHLDPGMAFGTGLHETTRLCADALLTHIGTANSRPSVLDVGTGSGILAIMARLLGAGTVAAVDNDPDALTVARENFVKNACPDIFVADDIGQREDRFDIVIANILLPTLLSLYDLIAARTKAGGILILSGITHEQEEPIIEKYRKTFVLLETSHRGEWSALTLRRKEPV